MRKFKAVGLVAIAALIAVACSDDKSTTDTTTAVDGTDGTDTTVAGGEVQVIKIGYAFPDLAAFAVLNKSFAIGDPQLQAEAVIDSWRRDGLLPEGIDIELVAAPYNIVEPAAKLGVCTSLAQDEQVFAVVAGISFTEGAECLATRYQTPIIDTDGAEPTVYSRGAPWFFTLRPDHVRQFVNYGYWAIDSGELDGKRVGMYFETKIIEGVEAMRALFEEQGVNLVSVTETSGIGIGGAEDPLSIERFIADDVEVALPLVGGSSAANMYGFAKGQDYRPVWLDMDYSEHTTDVAAKTNPPEQYDGTLAMTVTRVGERASGIQNPGAEACLANYERYAAVEIEREGIETGEYSSILRTCDLFAVLLAGLTGAADDLTKENFVTALENAGTIELVGSGNGSFDAFDHSFIDEYRTVQWDADCPCWKAISDFAPMRT
ncbi:MAG: hypothetical protein K8R99_09845 [Actinomycetia bacterium]|nr:hypothetical protein [Actinomycetes bacterium]